MPGAFPLIIIRMLKSLPTASQPLFKRQLSLWSSDVGTRRDFEMLSMDLTLKKNKTMCTMDFITVQGELMEHFYSHRQLL